MNYETNKSGRYYKVCSKCGMFMVSRFNEWRCRCGNRQVKEENGDEAWKEVWDRLNFQNLLSDKD